MRERDNTGSVARDQLANERTFLSWVRTGLGLVGVGVLLAKWVEEGRTAQLGGIGFILWGAVLLVYGIVRYRQVAELLDRGKYRTAEYGPLFVTVAGLIAASVAAAMVLL